MFNGDYFHVPVYAFPGDRAVQSGDWPEHRGSALSQPCCYARCTHDKTRLGALLRMPPFENVLEPEQVALHQPGVIGVLFLGHVRGTEQGEDHLASVSVRNDPHRVMELDTGRQLYDVVEHAERIALHEAKDGRAERRFHHPVTVDFLHRLAERRHPPRQVFRIRRERVNLLRRGGDGDADRSRRHQVKHFRFRCR